MMTSKANSASNNQVDGAVSKAAFLDQGGFPRRAGGCGARGRQRPLFFQGPSIGAVVAAEHLGGILGPCGNAADRFAGRQKPRSLAL